MSNSEEDYGMESHRNEIQRTSKIEGQMRCEIIKRNQK
jgi:hypothetical protein